MSPFKLETASIHPKPMRYGIQMLGIDGWKEKSIPNNEKKMFGALPRVDLEDYHESFMGAIRS